jgi:hypothetical protein
MLPLQVDEKGGKKGRSHDTAMVLERLPIGRNTGTLCFRNVLDSCRLHEPDR